MDLTTRIPIPHPQPEAPDSDTDTETPLQTHLSRALSLTNGSSSLHQHPPHAAVSYKECLKNHAASLGGLALDGCGEFMPSPSSSFSDPSSLKCAACGCHRNFHRRDHHLQPPFAAIHWTTTSSPSAGGQTSSGPSHSDPNSPASPIPQQSVYPSAPHMLLALSTGHSGPYDENHPSPMAAMNPHGRKRARTKFTEEQKEKMHVFAEKLGWKMMRGNDEKLVEEFCSEVGVKRNVFKVWMHNNKHRKEKGSSCDINKKVTTNFNCNSNFDSYQIESKASVHGDGASLDDGSSPSSS